MLRIRVSWASLFVLLAALAPTVLAEQAQHIINDRSDAISYTPLDNPSTQVQEGWVHANLGSQSVNQSYDSDYHTTYVRDAVASLDFTGSQVKIFSQGVPRGGLAEVRIDGGMPEVIDVQSPQRLDYMLVYEKYGLAPGKHQLEIKVLGKNKQGLYGNWWVSLDFVDTSAQPVLSPFTPDDIAVDFTSITPKTRVASWGESGRARMDEVGFVISQKPLPTIHDRKAPASLGKDDTFSVAISDLRQDTQYHIRPYIITDGTVYYGRDSVQRTKPQIELSEHTIGMIVGDASVVNVKTTLPFGMKLSWQVASGSGYDGGEKDVVEMRVNNIGNGIVLVGKAEGEAVIRVASSENPDLYTEIAVTVARPEKNTNIAATPPMGWSSWNVFGRIVDSQQIRATINALIAPITSDGKSLKDLGYDYVIVDGGWRQNWLEPDGSIVPNTYFGGVEGMKELIDYAHSKGLKFGLHVLPGVRDCADQFVGAKGNERTHLAAYKDWGVDFLKWDKCGGYGNPTPENVETMYKRMKYYMDNTGRDILFSVCNYVYTDWAPEVGNMWRTTGDIKTIVNSSGAKWSNFTDIAAKNSRMWATAGPGSWNDPDIMVVGDPGLSEIEWRTHFSLWSIMAAPLLLSMDLTDPKLSPKALDVVSNSEVIAVNQDSLGRQGRPIIKTSGFEIWAKPLADGGMVVMLMNTKEQASDITVSWSEVVYDSQYKLATGGYMVRDLWAHEDVGKVVDSYTAKQVPAHGVVMLKVTRESAK